MVPVIRKLIKDENPPLELLLLADPSRERVEKYLQFGECFVAEHGGNVAGVYVLLPLSAEMVELVNIAVEEDIQGKGLGKILVKDAIERARVKGYKTIEVGTGNSSIGQLALYQKCGFRIIGIDTDFFTKNYQEKIFENGIQCRDMVRLALTL